MRKDRQGYVGDQRWPLLVDLGLVVPAAGAVVDWDRTGSASHAETLHRRLFQFADAIAVHQFHPKYHR